MGEVSYTRLMDLGKRAADDGNLKAAYHNYDLAARVAEGVMQSREGFDSNVLLDAAYCRVYAGKNAIRVARQKERSAGSSDDVEVWMDSARGQLCDARIHLQGLMRMGVPIASIQRIFVDQVRFLDDPTVADMLDLRKPKREIVRAR